MYTILVVEADQCLERLYRYVLAGAGIATQPLIPDHDIVSQLQSIDLVLVGTQSDDDVAAPGISARCQADPRLPVVVQLPAPSGRLAEDLTSLLTVVASLVPPDGPPPLSPVLPVEVLAPPTAPPMLHAPTHGEENLVHAHERGPPQRGGQSWANGAPHLDRQPEFDRAA